MVLRLTLFSALRLTAHRGLIHFLLLGALGASVCTATPARAQEEEEETPKKKKKKKHAEEGEEGEKPKAEEGERTEEQEAEQARKIHAEQAARDKEEAERKAKEASEADAALSKGKDHDRWVGHIGASWFGVSTVPIATGGPTGTAANPGVAPGGGPAFVSVPAIGIRYWLSKLMAIDAGIGFSASTGSIRSTAGGSDKQSVFAMLFHVGVPLSPVAGKHIALLIMPEINFGFATSKVEPPQGVTPPPAASLFGQRFDIGARVGGEVYFGFIGLPELSLEGTFGAFLTHQRTSISVDTATYSETDVLATTANFKDPWQLFTSVIAARYYF